MSSRQILRTRWAWMPAGLEPWVELELDESGQILAHRSLKPGASVDHILLLPGMINAHLHLELSDQAGQVPPNEPGEPMVRWVSRSLALRGEPDMARMEEAATEMRRFGVAGCIDLSNGTQTASILAAQGLRGTALHELMGWEESRWQAALDRSSPPSVPGFAHRPTAHAPISCSPELLSQALAPGDIPCTIHCDEAAEDALLLRDGTGPWAELLDQLGRPWRSAWEQADSGVALLDSLGLLHPGLGLVHLVHAREHDLDLVARSGCTAVLCPRSNLHISGRLPDVPGMVGRGIPLAMGTDSLASSPDLDPLAEAALLASRFPDIEPETWLRAICQGGAQLLAQTGLGSLDSNTRPGVLSVQIPDEGNPLSRLLDGTRWERYWAA
jgi:cytosine/adenosine deaminase-related metal-dependent hydrolase